MITGIVFTAVGVIILTLGVRALIKGEALGNLYPVSGQRMPLCFWTSVVSDLVCGVICLVFGVIFLTKGT